MSDSVFYLFWLSHYSPNFAKDSNYALLNLFLWTLWEIMPDTTFATFLTPMWHINIYFRLLKLCWGIFPPLQIRIIINASFLMYVHLIFFVKKHFLNTYFFHVMSSKVHVLWSAASPLSNSYITGKTTKHLPWSWAT